ncbi:hypothetical protein MNBD_GAMMA10-316 [hydrothermal vent metagenome]|uniref:Uncharacterized protein n=1 Tax=hydrothermal vent metagenome TaxID=652676 RepID=A0A3B0X8A4_9ZZZZ
MALKRGSAISDSAFVNSMAEEIENAFQTEWNALKDTPLPAGTAVEQDRKILFAAISQGVLNYLHRQKTDIPTTVNSGVDHKHTLDFDIE